MISGATYTDSSLSTIVVIVDGSATHIGSDYPEENPVKAALGSWLADGNVVALPAVATVKIPNLSRRQFFTQAKIAGLITFAEAKAAIAGAALPLSMQQALASLNLSAADAENAELLILGATEFRRDLPLCDQIGAAMGMSSGQQDDFWIAASVL